VKLPGEIGVLAGGQKTDFLIAAAEHQRLHAAAHGLKTEVPHVRQVARKGPRGIDGIPEILDGAGQQRARIRYGRQP